MEILDRKGVTISEVLENYGKYDLPEFLINKINFLIDSNYKTSTASNFLRVFINYTLQYEMYKNKDLYLFDKQELLDVINSVNTSSIRVKKNLESLINGYINYNIGRGRIFTNINPMTAILEDETRSINKKKLKSKYISVDECFEIYEKAMTEETLTAQDAILVLLARFSVTNEEMSNLDINDIDRENKRLIIRDDENNIVRFIPIDDRMINKLDEAIETTEYTKGKAKRQYTETGLLLKPAGGSATIVGYVVLRKRYSQVMQAAGKGFISMKDLNKNYLIDRLIDVNREKGYLTNDDIKDVLVMVNREPNSSYFSLKEDLLLMNPNLDIRKSEVVNKN